MTSVEAFHKYPRSLLSDSHQENADSCGDIRLILVPFVETKLTLGFRLMTLAIIFSNLSISETSQAHNNSRTKERSTANLQLFEMDPLLARGVGLVTGAGSGLFQTRRIQSYTDRCGQEWVNKSRSS